MDVYYNEFEPYAAQWLRNLIDAGELPKGVVDERDIRDVTPADLEPYAQCHFFAGIGIWALALARAGFPADYPIWSGSCPCQPFSSAGKGDGFADERHLWPHFHYLIEQRRPAVVVGEQVATKDGLGWLDLVQTDLEGSDYACGAVDTCAAGYGAPHIRQRLYFTGIDNRHSARLGNANGQPVQPEARDLYGAAGAIKGGGSPDGGVDHGSRGASQPDGLANTDTREREGGSDVQKRDIGNRGDSGRTENIRHTEQHSAPDGLANASGSRRDIGSGLRDSGAEREGSKFADLCRPSWVGNARCSRTPPWVSKTLGRRKGFAEKYDDRSGGCVRSSKRESVPVWMALSSDGGCKQAGISAASEERDGFTRNPVFPERFDRTGPACATNGEWADADWLFSRDGKWRPVEAGTFPLAHGCPSRVGRLRAYGNAIVAPQAQIFCEELKQIIQQKEYISDPSS